MQPQFRDERVDELLRRMMEQCQGGSESEDESGSPFTLNIINVRTLL